MKKKSKITRFFLVSFFSIVPSLLLCLQGQDRQTANNSVSIEVLMTDRMFGDFTPGAGFLKSIDITSERFILLSAPDQYYVLGWGGIVPLGGRINGEIQSFAYTPDGLLLTVRGNDLCSFDDNGNLTPLIRLPLSGMGISAGKEVMYLFDSGQDQKTHPLYVFAREGKYMKLIEVPDPIASVAETDDEVLLAAGSKLYGVNPATKEVKLLFAEENGGKILSVATDRSNGISYFSTADRVYAIRDLNLAAVAEKTGGILKYYNGLIVFNPETRQVIRILGLEKELVARTEKPGEVTFKQGPVDQAGNTAQAPQTAATQPAATQPAVNQPAATRPDGTPPAATVPAVTQPAGTPPAPTVPAVTQPAATPPAPTSVAAGTKDDIGTVKVLTNESIKALVKNGLSESIIITLIRRAKVDFSLTTDDVIDLSGNGVSPEVIIEMRQAMKRQQAETQNRQ